VTADRSTSNELDLITDPAALSFQPAADCCALRDAPPLESPDGTPLWPPADDFRKTRPGRRGPGKQFPQQASSPRPSYAEVEQRIAEAQLWIAQRLPMAVIREKAKSSWGVESTFTLQKYLRTARQRMVNELITDRLAHQAEQIYALMEIARRAADAEQFSAAVGAHRVIAEIAGILRAPIKAFNDASQ